MELATETVVAKDTKEKGTHDIVVPLEVLLSSPMILKSKKAIQFLEKCHDGTKEDSNMKDFKISVNENAHKLAIWPVGKTWEDVINENEEGYSEKSHYKLLRTFINKDGTPRKKLVDVDPNSVTDLLGVIRNKYSHKGLISEDVLKTLGWGKEISSKFEFCDERFLAYWTYRFPKLLPFLWEQYKEPMSEKNPGGAYPPFFKSQYSSCCLFNEDEVEEGKKSGFGGQLSKALLQNLEQGGLEDRFSFGKKGAITLEFRTLETCYFDMDKFNFLEIEIPGIGERRIIRKWYEVSNDQITVAEANTISLAYEKPDTSRESFSGRILVCNKLSDLSDYFSKDQCIDVFIRNHKFIIFSNREHKLEQETKTSIVNKFLEVLRIKYCTRQSVTWSDLRITTQNTLIKQVDIKIQGICIKFEDFLKDAENTGTLDKILLNLQGTELNEMLKTKTIVIPELDANIKPPTSQQMYISRKVYSRGNVSSNFFLNEATKSQFHNRFIIIHSGEQKVPSDENIKFTKIHSLNEFQNIDINDSESTLFYVEEPIQNFANISINFKCSVETDVNVHIFECLEDEEFQWVTTTHGSFTGIHECLYKEAEMSACNEEAFLNNILKRKPSGGMIFVSDEPGMGKTKLLMNLARTMRYMEKTCVLLFEMRDIVENVGEIVSKDQILNTITDLSCSESFGKEIIRHLLRSNTLGIYLEIMIDGLDEVQSKHTNLAFEVLKVFQREIPWVTVWVTGRDFLLEDVRLELGVLGYKLLPFTEDEQMVYIMALWIAGLKNSGEIEDPPCDSTIGNYLTAFLVTCVFKEEINLAGIPLQCKMIAEIFEEEVLKGDFSLIDTNGLFYLHTLYEEIFEKRFRVYWKEKQKLSVPTDHDVAERERQRIENYLVYLSIKLIFTEDTADKLKAYLLIPRKQRDLEKLQKDVLKHGIIQSLSPLRFIHRTYAEYIVAWFVTQEVEECLESNECLDSIEGVVKDLILNDVLTIEGSANSLSFQHTFVASFLNTTLEPALTNVSNIFKEQEITSVYHKLGSILNKPIRDKADVCCHENPLSIHTKLYDTAYEMKYKYILIVSILLSENPLNSCLH